MKKFFTLCIMLLVVLVVGVLFSFVGKKKLVDENEMVLYSAMSSKSGSLDPGSSTSVASAVIINHIFDCLYEYHYLKRPYSVIPRIAEGMPQISEDGLTYIIPIRKGLYFSDDPCFENGKGRELTAKDVVYSWKRIANIKFLSPSWWVFDSRVVGLDEFREYTKTCKLSSEVDYSKEVEGLKALDDYTLQIKLKKPWPQILYNFSKTATAPVAREAVEYYGKSIINHPIGTAAYVLKTWNKGSYIELERNPKFNNGIYPSEGEESDIEKGFLVDAGKSIPFIDRIYFMKIEEEPPSWFLFLKGKLDSSYIPKDNFSQAIIGKELTPEMKKRGIQLQIYKMPSSSWIGFNLEDSVIGKNKPLRQAISYAIDRERFIELFANGILDKAYGVIPPIMKSYNSELSKNDNYDLTRAKTFVEQAKGINGGDLPELMLTMAGTSVTDRQYGQFFRNEFDKIGLKLNVDYLDAPLYFAELRKGKFQLYFGGVQSSAPDAYNILNMFHSKNFLSGNYFHYKSKRYDDAFDRASAMFDSPERSELYRECEKALIDDCIAVFMFHGVSYTLQHDWVENYKPSALQFGLAKFIKTDSLKRQAYQEIY